MSTYTTYKAREAEVMIEKAFHISWTPEREEVGSQELDALWESLTAEERSDLILWLKAREG